MNIKFYEKYGKSLSILGIIVLILVLLFGFPFAAQGLIEIFIRIVEHGLFGPNITALAMLFSLFTTMIVIAIYTIVPGYLFKKFSKENKEENKLVKIPVYLLSIALAIMLLDVLFTAFSCIGGCDPLGIGLIFLFVLYVIFLPLATIALILLIINYFKNKK